MRTYRQIAHRIDYTNSGETTISSGDVVVMGDMIGIAVTDIASGETGVVEIDGIHELAAANCDAWSIGEQLYWDASGAQLTDTVGSNVKAGRAANAKTQHTVLAEVILNNND